MNTCAVDFRLRIPHSSLHRRKAYVFEPSQEATFYELPPALVETLRGHAVR